MTMPLPSDSKSWNLPGNANNNNNQSTSPPSIKQVEKQISWHFDMCRFAERLRKYEAIWNVKCRDYGNRDKRKAQFKALGNEFGLTADSVECKYHSMRTYYVKQKKKTQSMFKKAGSNSSQSSSDAFTPVWPPYKLLSFLDDTIDQRAPKDSSHTLELVDTSMPMDQCDNGSENTEIDPCEVCILSPVPLMHSQSLPVPLTPIDTPTMPPYRSGGEATEGMTTTLGRRCGSKVRRESQSDDCGGGNFFTFDDDGSIVHASRAKHAKIEPDVGAFVQMIGHQLNSVRHPLRRMQIMHRVQGIVVEEVLRGSPPPAGAPVQSPPTAMSQASSLYQAPGGAYLVRHGNTSQPTSILTAPTSTFVPSIPMPVMRNHFPGSAAGARPGGPSAESHEPASPLHSPTETVAMVSMLSVDAPLVKAQAGVAAVMPSFSQRGGMHRPLNVAVPTSGNQHGSAMHKTFPSAQHRQQQLQQHHRHHHHHGMAAPASASSNNGGRTGNGHQSQRGGHLSRRNVSDTQAQQQQQQQQEQHSEDRDVDINVVQS
ncbi:uncharacterized protein LOC135820871 [Sycon ciliatum]|uniref:uncharacterized protein LOC135820871 n=1 Tax=Sycon ciliatum TaxID=27933 RepID=UPI0031F700B7